VNEKGKARSAQWEGGGWDEVEDGSNSNFEIRGVSDAEEKGHSLKAGERF